MTDHRAKTAPRPHPQPSVGVQAHLLGDWLTLQPSLLLRGLGG